MVIKKIKINKNLNGLVGSEIIMDIELKKEEMVVK